MISPCIWEQFIFLIGEGVRWSGEEWGEGTNCRKVRTEKREQKFIDDIDCCNYYCWKRSK